MNWLQVAYETQSFEHVVVTNAQIPQLDVRKAEAECNVCAKQWVGSMRRYISTLVSNIEHLRKLYDPSPGAYVAPLDERGRSRVMQLFESGLLTSPNTDVFYRWLYVNHASDSEKIRYVPLSHVARLVAENTILGVTVQEVAETVAQIDKAETLARLCEIVQGRTPKVLDALAAAKLESTTANALPFVHQLTALAACTDVSLVVRGMLDEDKLQLFKIALTAPQIAPFASSHQLRSLVLKYCMEQVDVETKIAEMAVTSAMVPRSDTLIAVVATADAPGALAKLQKLPATFIVLNALKAEGEPVHILSPSSRAMLQRPNVSVNNMVPDTTATLRASLPPNLRTAVGDDRVTRWAGYVKTRVASSTGTLPRAYVILVGDTVDQDHVKGILQSAWFNF